jgi:hypothetical protein
MRCLPNSSLGYEDHPSTSLSKGLALLSQGIPCGVGTPYLRHERVVYVH